MATDEHSERLAKFERQRDERWASYRRNAEALVEMDPEFLETTYAKGVHPDLVFGRMEADGAVQCVDNIEFAWDQWMQCLIKCDHGVFQGVSDSAWFNPMGQSFLAAYQEWVKHEAHEAHEAHQTPQSEE